MATTKNGKSFAEIMSELQGKKYRPVYFLTGDEPYYIDKITDYIEHHVLRDDEKVFNQSVLYGREVNVRDIITDARRFPLNSDRMVIIIKEAQNVKNLNELEQYVKSPQATTLLVICHKPKADKSGERSARLTALLNAVEKAGGVRFVSNKLYDNQVPAWVQDYLTSKDIKIDPVASQLLVEHLGNDLNKIAHELDKLITALPQGTTTIGTKQVEDNIGISKDFNRFELTKAISERNVMKCNRIANYFTHNASTNPLVLTMSTLHQHFVRILKTHLMAQASDSELAQTLGVNPYFVREYRTAARSYSLQKTASVLTLLRDYDLRSKGINNGTADHGELLRELLFYILH